MLVNCCNVCNVWNFCNTQYTFNFWILQQFLFFVQLIKLFLTLYSYVSDWPVISFHTIWQEERDFITDNTLRNEGNPLSLQDQKFLEPQWRVPWLLIFDNHLLVCAKNSQKDKYFFCNICILTKRNYFLTFFFKIFLKRMYIYTWLEF